MRVGTMPTAEAAPVSAKEDVKSRSSVVDEAEEEADEDVGLPPRARFFAGHAGASLWTFLDGQVDSGLQDKC